VAGRAAVQAFKSGRDPNRLRAVEAHSPEAPAFGSTVTIFFSDIRGFTEYTDRHGDEAAYRMLRIHNSLVQEQFALYRGHVVKTQGDSFMVSFESARTAVTCAIAIQKSVRDANRDQVGPGIQVGIGINTGEPVREGADFFGGTVNLASRICAVAAPGQILVSETVRAVTGKMEGSAFLDRGGVELKGFREPQQLYEVVDAADAPPQEPEEPEAPAIAPAPAPVAPRKVPAPTVAGLGARRPAWLIPVAAVLILLLVAGTALFVVRGRGGGSPATPTFPHGKLLYQPKAEDAAWSPDSPPSADPEGSAAVSYSGSSIHFDILQPGGNLGGQLEGPALKDFALELVMTAAPGTDLEINWWLRSTEDSSLELYFNLSTEAMSLIWTPNVGDPVTLVKDIRLDGLQSGRTYRIGVVASGAQVTIYRDGSKVAQVQESRAEGGTNPGFYMDGNSGSLHLDSIRYYAVR
jgi:class 3 adenylate cyclase